MGFISPSTRRAPETIYRAEVGPPVPFTTSRTSHTLRTIHAPDSTRLGHRDRVAAHLLRAGAVLRPSCGPQHVRVLRLGPRGAVVARRALDGGDDVQRGYAESGDRHRAAQRRGRQLGVVGLRADGRLDGLLLRAPVAAVRRADRPGVL